MARFTIDIPDNLNDWLIRQASQNQRSKHKHIRFILQQAQAESSKPRYILNSPNLCYNGTHNFKSDNPSTKDFCNCGMFVLGELQ